MGNNGITRPADTGKKTIVVSQGKLLMMEIEKNFK
jgi:hypothetical protein